MSAGRALPVLGLGDAVPVGEASLHDMYEHAPCGLLSSDLSGVVRTVNATFLEWSGYRREQVVGRLFADLLTAGSRVFYETRCLPVLRLQGEVREVALQLRATSGIEFPMLVNSRVDHDEHGTPRAVWTAVFDATSRRDYERDLLAARRAAERSEARVRVLQDASSRFAEALTEHDLFDALAEAARTALDAASVTVMALGAEGMLRWAGGARHPLGDCAVVAGTRPEAQAVRDSAVVRIRSLDDADRAWPDLAGPLHDARTEALTAAPLVGEAGPLGAVVCLFGRRRDRDDDETPLLQALAGQAVLALQRQRLQGQLEQMATQDPLTHLANRRSLAARLRDAVASGRRSGRPVAVLFMDLDGFKVINDELGHAAGDAVLVHVADRLRTCVRDGDTLARFGGDEFVLLCEDVDRASAQRVADRIRAAVRQHLPGLPDRLSVTASVGIVHHSPAGGRALEADALLYAADEAMYASKRQGKDRHTLVVL